MTVAIAIVIVFFLLNALSAINWRSVATWGPIKNRKTPRHDTPGKGYPDQGVRSRGIDTAEYVLAGRALAGPALLATLAASNLSAFTIFGVSGASYRLGWAFFPVMAFGTAFMAFSCSG